MSCELEAVPGVFAQVELARVTSLPRTKHERMDRMNMFQRLRSTVACSVRLHLL